MENIYDTACKIAKEIGTSDPISLTTDFFNSTVRVGYNFSGHPIKRSVVVQFGAYLAVLTMRELEVVIAHEFAHIVKGHTSKNAFLALHLAQRCNNRCTKLLIENFVVGIVRLRNLMFATQREFEADKLATEKYGSGHLATALVKGAAFDLAFEEYLQHKHIFGERISSKDLQSLWQSNSSELPPNEIAMFISRTFRLRQDIFLRCSRLARAQDHSSLAFPSISKRLRRIGYSWEQAESQSFALDSDTIDLSYFENYCTP